MKRAVALLLALSGCATVKSDVVRVSDSSFAISVVTQSKAGEGAAYTEFFRQATAACQGIGFPRFTVLDIKTSGVEPHRKPFAQGAVQCIAEGAAEPAPAK